MAYVSLYRKYRPQTFEDVVGQEHVTRTLQNAIREGRVASGYLFTGTRGTAKTTCARILAKALNCIGADGTRTAPTPDPCGVCGPCRAIAASAFVDVLEMDAASHGKVDDVRDLVASIKFPPMEGRYKVYIIDEAHQLSRDAMDAFLKTLEEPPDRVLFILATTELDKLPITIASRCQVFEFKRGSVAQIAARLAHVLQQEGVQAEPQAITLVARAADGSYRDSLSLLEQVLAYKRQHITPHDVTIVLGTIDEDLLTRVVSLIAASDAAGAFALAGDIMASGKDVRQFLKSLTQRFRDMLFVGVGAQTSAAGDIDDSDGLRAQAAQFSPAALLQALEILTEAESETKRNNQHRLLLEMALLRLMRLPETASAPAPFVASAAPVPTMMPQTVTPAVTIAPAAVVPTPTEVSQTDLSVADGGIPPPLAIADAEEDDLPETEINEVFAAEMPQPGDDDLDLMLLDDEEDSGVPSLVITSSDEHDEADSLLHVQQVAAAPPVSAPAPKPKPAEDVPPELLRLQKAWDEVVNRVGGRSPTASADVRNARPVALDGTVVTLEFDKDSAFHFDRVQGKEALRTFIGENIDRTLGAEVGTYRVKCVMQGHSLPAKVALGTAPKPREAVPAPRQDAHSPWMDEVIAVFGGQILDETDGK